MKPQKCFFYIFTAAAIQRNKRVRQDAADAGIAHDPRNDEPPKPIRFATHTVPQIGDELSTDIEDRAVRVKILKRTWIFLGAETDPENVSIKLDVEELA